ADFLPLLRDERTMKCSWDTATRVLHWFMKAVLPYLPRAALESLRPDLRKELQSATWPTDPYKRPAPAFYLAAFAGLHDELLGLVTSWPDDRYGMYDWDDYYHQPQLVVFGLASPDLVGREMRRLKLRLKIPAHARAWLAHTELSALDYLRDTIRALTNKQKAADLFEVFRLVRAAEAAPHMLELRLNSKVPQLASQWLDEQRGNAIAGLIPVAAGRGKLAEAAVEFLRDAKKKGHADFIVEQLKGVAAEVAARVREAVLEHEEKVYEPLTGKTTPRWLSRALAAAPAVGKLPGFADPASLPPVLVDGRRLNDEQARALLAALKASPLGAPQGLVAALKQHADAASLDAFAWRLFDAWLVNGGPPGEKWAFLSLGHLGGDATALRLTPLVRAWPGEGQHARAVLGLECLRAIGTDTALMQLNGIAQKLKFQALKNKAREFMEAVARDRGLSREELEDRIVPDLDLDERGGRALDFGPRRFRVVLGPDLTPLVRDADGKVRADLPKPSARDDEEKAKAAVADWKLLKKQLREAMKVQAPRLEQAMVTGRRWTVRQFEALLVRHPLMTNLARRLLWAGYDGKGRLAVTFRVTEEQEYADVNDRPVALKGLAAIGIVHPLRLTEEQRAAWGQVFGDYEIIEPFPQLGRPVLAPEADEAKGKTITRLAKVKLAPAAVRWTLEKSGWVRGSTSDHGIIQEFYKQFPGSAVTAVLEVEPGIPIGMPDWSDEQTVPRVFYLK
ncbi:MAG TPA: DUF4132 domain-containing protein, partial [Gemmataceae bacterium]|nr:DUF4132 domain-containing protein [Gemmataceae bacterium]